MFSKNREFKTYKQSKKAFCSFSDYVKYVITRIAKYRALYRDEYAKIALKLVLKHQTNPSYSTLNALNIDRNGDPYYGCGFGRFLSNGIFEICFFDATSDTAKDGEYCKIDKSGGCLYCFAFLTKSNTGFLLNRPDYLCKTCRKKTGKNNKFHIEAKEIRKLTNKLKVLCHEKIKRDSPVFN